MQNNFDQMESNLLKMDDLDDTRVDIRPQYYIHHALILSQRTLLVSLLKDNISDGFTAYRVFIEHIETLAKAANLIDIEEYKKEIKEFKKSNEYNSEDDKFIKTAKLSNFKLELLMKKIFRGSSKKLVLFDARRKKINEEEA